MRFVHYSESEEFRLDASKVDANAARPGLFVYPASYHTDGWPGRHRIEIDVAEGVAEPFQSFGPGELVDEPEGLEEWFIPAGRFGEVQIIGGAR